MDKRTIKIRRLESKLIEAKMFVRQLAKSCVEMEDGKTLSKSYWGKQAIDQLESLAGGSEWVS